MRAVGLFRSVTEANPASGAAQRSHFRWAYAALRSTTAKWRYGAKPWRRRQLELWRELIDVDEPDTQVVRRRAFE